MSKAAQRQVRQRFPFDALTVDETAEEPLYCQLEAQIRAAILEGRLQPGTRLPSTRRLASDLGVARNTVINAYDQLIVEGYLVSTKGSGTRVAHDLPEHLLQVPHHEAAQVPREHRISLSTVAERISGFAAWMETAADRSIMPFRAHTPASDAFPRELWAQLTVRRLRRSSRALLERVDPRGYPPLRQAIAGYLGSTRGVACTPDQVIITAGVQQALELIATLLIEPGDTVCMEDPGYTPARVLFELAGGKVVASSVDEEGLRVTELKKIGSATKLVYVTPSSQFPLGMTMSLPRRLALVEWAEQTGALILEDDYNGEYRYVGRPQPALYGMASRGRVLYTGSFSKLLFPSLRIGYVVIPEYLVDVFAAARWLIDRHSPPLEQAVLTDFIDEGHFVRHVRRMRTLYAERQAALVNAASEELDGILKVPACDAGLHLIGWLEGDMPESVLMHAAETAAVVLSPTSWFSIHQQARQSVILGYAPFSPREIRHATKALARECRAHLKHSPVRSM